MLAWGFGDFKGGEIFPWRNYPLRICPRAKFSPPLYVSERVGVVQNYWVSLAKQATRAATPWDIMQHRALPHERVERSGVFLPLLGEAREIILPPRKLAAAGRCPPTSGCVLFEAVEWQRIA